MEFKEEKAFNGSGEVVCGINGGINDYKLWCLHSKLVFLYILSH